MTFSPLDSRLLGPLFTTPEMAALASDEAFLAAMLRVEAALAAAQAKHGLVPPELAPAIRALGPGDFDLGALGAATARAGVPVIPFVKALGALLPPDLEPHLHFGATTQDVHDTATVLILRDALAPIRHDLARVVRGLAALARRHRETPCVARTYGQHAVPSSMGFAIAVWLAGVLQVVRALEAVETGVAVVSLGGPAGTLHGLGAHGPAILEAVAAELGLGAPSISWHARRDAIAALGAWLGRLLGALGKMAADVALLAGTDIAEVAEPHAPGRGGSSAMPHKRNPVGATVILAAQRASLGHVTTLIAAMVAEHQRPAGAWHAEWHALPQLLGLAAGALREAVGIAEGLEVDAARCAANLGATRGLLFADRAAAALTPSLGRAAAHARVTDAADRARAKGSGLAAELAADPVVAAALDAPALAALFDPADAVAAAARFVDRVLDGMG
jgi:3-carboxy-cis,cis-muconate cycloisomerase